VKFLLAAEDAAIPLVLGRPERADRGAELLDLPPVFRPVSRALRGDRPVVVGLRLPEELRGRA
jgi:hypothetical protein